MAARKKSLNPEGTLLSFGADAVRLERGIADPNDRESPVHWVVYQRQDVTDDPDTTYTYRFEEVGRYPEDAHAPGEVPEEALERAQALADAE